MQHCSATISSCMELILSLSTVHFNYRPAKNERTRSSNNKNKFIVVVQYREIFHNGHLQILLYIKVMLALGIGAFSIVTCFCDKIMYELTMLSLPISTYLPAHPLVTLKCNAAGWNTTSFLVVQVFHHVSGSMDK